MVPFHLHFTLNRRQRLEDEVYPWLPCLAASLGFTLGIAFLSVVVSRWFLPLLVLPPLVSRGFFAIVLDLILNPRQPAELVVDQNSLGFATGGSWRWLPLEGIIQVFRSGQSWTVLHLNGAVLNIPLDAIAEEQIDYLKGFALRAARMRKEAVLEAE